jgi:hypothetical protein
MRQEHANNLEVKLLESSASMKQENESREVDLRHQIEQQFQESHSREILILQKYVKYLQLYSILHF